MRKLWGLLTLLLVAACVPGQLPPGEPAGALGFAARPGAALISSASVSPVLVPVGDCVFGFDLDGSERVASTRQGADGCTRLEADRTRKPSDPYDAIAAVPGPGGSVLGIGQSFVRWDPSGEITRLFPLGPDRRAAALARVGRNVIGVGYREFTGEERSVPVAWVSEDEGRSAREVVLPQDRPGRWAPRAIASDGDQVLVAGALGADVRVWASGDAGATWTVSPVQVRTGDPWLSTVLRVAGKWLLAGGSSAGALVMTGGPGAWEPVSLGEGRILGGTVDKAGDAVLFGDRTEWNRSQTSNRSCAVVWVSGGGWQRGELGCPAEGITAAVTIRDGRVLLASNRDLWIRPS